MRIMFSLVAVLFLASFTNAQAPQPQYTPDPGESTRRIRENERTMAQMEATRSGNLALSDMRLFRRKFGERFELLYRDLSAAELRNMSADPAIRAQFSDVLSRKDTGLIKLLPLAACSSDARVVRADDLCSKYDFPGSGASYSFRNETYRIQQLADITLSDGKFVSRGDLTHGIFTDLGDLGLDQLTAESAAAKAIAALQPASDVQNAIRFARELDNGIRRGDIVFRRAMKVTPNTTFLLRSIAYKGPNYKVFEKTTYDEFMFDKRRDTIVAVRVVAVDPDGAVTLLWKKLSEKRAAGPLRAE